MVDDNRYTGSGVHPVRTMRRRRATAPRLRAMGVAVRDEADHAARRGLRCRKKGEKAESIRWVNEVKKTGYEYDCVNRKWSRT